MTSPWIPRAELARMLGLHPKTLQVMHRRGILRGVPVTPGGRRVVYRVEDVEAYLEGRRGAA